jgi:hypothetical protein
MSRQPTTAVTNVGKWRVELVSWHGYGDAVIRVYWRPSWWERWFAGIPKVGTYRGSVTVWRDMATKRRCGVVMELRLSDCWAALRGGDE